MPRKQLNVTLTPEQYAAVQEAAAEEGVKLSLLPGVAITIVVLALNFFGDWMRDTLDPKLRRA